MLYAYTTTGDQRCLITIPESAGMSRVDGFFISADGTTAWIADSQGPIYADDTSFENARLGGSVYQVEWTNPCGCSNDGSGAACDVTTAIWSPTVEHTLYIDATDAAIGDGGGNDNYFRNSVSCRGSKLIQL